MKLFIEDFKDYFKYIIYATRSELKSEVANSYLNWIWWLLEPICFMLIYAFISIIVFRSKEPNFTIFVFIG
ncbi:MAG: polysaccharide ABC transporter, partial [Bacilli bacterium]|nr:polysaccharide ABC transporter [Bacilli bacterium]